MYAKTEVSFNCGAECTWWQASFGLGYTNIPCKTEYWILYVCISYTYLQRSSGYIVRLPAIFSTRTWVSFQQFVVPVDLYSETERAGLRRGRGSFTPWYAGTHTQRVPPLSTCIFKADSLEQRLWRARIVSTVARDILRSITCSLARSRRSRYGCDAIVCW